MLLCFLMPSRCGFHSAVQVKLAVLKDLPRNEIFLKLQMMSDKPPPSSMVPTGLPSIRPVSFERQGDGACVVTAGGPLGGMALPSPGLEHLQLSGFGK